MKTTLVITVTSLVVAAACTVFSEKRASRWGTRFAWAALFAIYGVCVGVVATVVVYFFSLRELTAIVIALPLAVPALLAALKMSEP